MVAFAANSILCRVGLGRGAIDAANYTSVRLVAGAAMLAIIAGASGKARLLSRTGSWISGALLSVYAVTFSFAYVSLSVGAGALLLFGAVQATMIGSGMLSGERPSPIEWVGLGVALAGLICLLSPGVRAPSPAGSALMIGAGIAWGLYSLRGRSVADPLVASAANFLRSVPLALAVSLLFFRSSHLTPGGVALAALSGSVASGCGYVVWYAALKRLSATRAATVQLSVPVITALGGAVILHEALSLQLLLSSVLILGGIALSTSGRSRTKS
jgi:drug/metabolite transporter (DMT)-like permease